MWRPATRQLRAVVVRIVSRRRAPRAHREYARLTLRDFKAAVHKPQKAVLRGKQTGPGGPMHIAGRPPPVGEGAGCSIYPFNDNAPSG